MNSSITNINSTQRLTVSLPGYVYQQLLNVTTSGKVSSFVAAAVRDRIAEQTMVGDPIREFANLKGVLPKMTVRQIKKIINRGRA